MAYDLLATKWSVGVVPNLYRRERSQAAQEKTTLTAVSWRDKDGSKRYDEFKLPEERQEYVQLLEFIGANHGYLYDIYETPAFYTGVTCNVE
jgi:hypothetical protein